MSATADLFKPSRDEGIAGLARRILEPLCEDTAKLLQPVRVAENDRLDLQLDEEGTNFVVQAYATLNGRRVQGSWAATKQWAINVPEREELGNNRWKIAATDITALIINANWTDDKIDFTDESRTVYTFLLQRYLSQTLQSQHRAKFKLMGVLPELPADFVETAAKPLSAYQKVACVCSLGQEAAAYFAEQGTGKTPPAITRVCIEATRFAAEQVVKKGKKRQLFRVLIVAPKNVRFNWQREFHEFATQPGKVTVLTGGQVQRQAQLLETIMSEDGDDSIYAVCICSYETVRMSWDVIRMVQWHMVIADEAHFMKEPRTERFKTMRQLRNISDMRMVLTGTPICNTPLDLYAQLEFLGEGMSGFTSWQKFKKFYAQFQRSEDGQRESIIGYQNLPFLQERLARIAFMITKKEAMPDLPEKVYDTRDCSMTPKQRQCYEQLAAQIAIEIESEEKTLTAQHILTKLLRLAQITSGFIVWDAKIDPLTGDIKEAKKVEYFEPIPKLEELVADLKAMPENEKALVWACFKPDIRAISERLTREGIPHVTFTGDTGDAERVEAERRFNCDHARDCKVFVGNAAAGGTGLNLRGFNPDAAEDHGCNATLVGYYSQGWSMVHRNQSEDRAHRRGTRVNVQYRDYCVPGTIDEAIRERVMKKTVTALTIQDVREIMRRVLDTMPVEDE